MGCPLSHAEATILSGTPLSAYEQDILDNLPPSQEWLSQISALANLKPAEASEAPRAHKPYKQSKRDAEAAKKRAKLVSWMSEHGGMISSTEAREVYGGSYNLMYHAMELLIADGQVEVLSSRPKVWGLTK